MAEKELPIDNSSDIIDSRDVIERIEFLQAKEALTEDESEELLKLIALQTECDGREWKDGIMLIRDSYFLHYAQELAEDTGSIDRSAGWPACHIDWEAAIAALKTDYMQVDFDSETYWRHG